ncbi:TPA: hypothetical protein JLF54_005043, partial [Escherichia coli]|nr:hypothetical protein [Escherichia coli]
MGILDASVDDTGMAHGTTRWLRPGLHRLAAVARADGRIPGRRLYLAGDRGMEQGTGLKNTAY